MKQILWFRRDLRISDNEILAYAKGEVLPIFIFDTNILNKLSRDDKRVSFIYERVLKLKEELKEINLDLALFYGDPKEIFKHLKTHGFNKVLCGVDHDAYALKRDNEIEQIMPMQRFNNSFLLHPNQHLNQSNLPYKVFTPFYKALNWMWSAMSLETVSRNPALSLSPYPMPQTPSLKEMGFEAQALAAFLSKSPEMLVALLISKLDNYEVDRDFFAKEATSQLSVYLRFGLLSPKEFFNSIRPYANSQSVIRQLFFREFYNYLLYHFPHTAFQNHKKIEIK